MQKTPEKIKLLIKCSREDGTPVFCGKDRPETKEFVLQNGNVLTISISWKEGTLSWADEQE